MCNRFKSKIQSIQISNLMRHDFTILQEAQTFEQREDQRPSQEALLFFERDGLVVLGTGFWGFPKEPWMGKGIVINARRERIGTSPFWRDSVPCWLPVTSWIEILVVDNKNVPQEVSLPGGEPFLLAGVCAMRGNSRRWSMQMQDAPSPLTYLCDRLPLAYGFDAIGTPNPVQLMDRMVVAPE